MTTNNTKLRDDKVLRNYKNLTPDGQKAHLELISYLKMMESLVEKTKAWIDEKNLPTHSDIKKHNMINSQYRSEYMN